MTKGLTSAGLGLPLYKTALRQHERYIEILKSLGVSVTIIEADENFPDSVFIEDTALTTPHCAVITNPGAPSRKGEIVQVEKTLHQFYNKIEFIKSPGCLDAGDVMNVGNHYYIGISKRTNYPGAQQLTAILRKYGMSSTLVPLYKVLHLKSGASYIENNTLITAGEFINRKEFGKFIMIKADPSESYAANCIWINGKVIIASSYPRLRNTLQSHGYSVAELDMSEFQKLDGGLSCLSLRF